MRLFHTSHAQGPRGYTLIETLFTLAAVAMVVGVAGVQASSAIDTFNAVAAARYVAARMHEARLEALRQNANVALRFRADEGGIAYAVYRDANRNGVLSREIDQGIDSCVNAPEHLGDRFGGIDFGVAPGLPAIDASSAPPGDDAIRFGASDMAVFTPSGTSTPGTVYIRSARGSQLAVRVFGDTGRTRVLRYHAAARRWLAL